MFAMYSYRSRPAPPKVPTIIQNHRYKHFRSDLYNYAFDLRSGHFKRWGKTEKSQPPWSPYGPEVLNVEISAGAGCPMHCAVCYKKGNTTGDTPKNMSFERFKVIFDKLPSIVNKRNGKRLFFTTAINFEITSINKHSELWDIFDYCRENGVIPNITLNGFDPMSNNTMMRVVDTCGIINVSINRTSQQTGFNQIERMLKYGANRLNIRYVVNKQSLDFLYDDLLPALTADKRLVGLHEIVFEGLKPVNRGSAFDIMPDEEYIRLMNYLVKKKIRFSYDTCSASAFEKALSFLDFNSSQKKAILERSNRCEAGLYSGYIDVGGKWWHCSFGQGIGKADGSIDVTQVNDFHKEVWMAEPIKKWRKEVFLNQRECSLFSELRVNNEKESELMYGA